MKKRKGLFGYIVIIGIMFIIFITIITSDSSSNYYHRPVSLNRLRISNIFSFKPKINIDEYKPYITMEVVDDGQDIYIPKRVGYRYGPSIMLYEDGSMDAWFASNGNNSSEWDWITYRHYDGVSWSNEEVVLRPTPKSKDHYSVCDPGVIYFDGYYYLGYTSTENATSGGVENCGYVARSKNPNGPFEKWNGNGWGGDPEPIIVYDKNDLAWGAGELSFVAVEEKLYCYYTWIESGGAYTKLAISDLSENWPAHLVDKGVVIERVNDQGSFDVVYNQENKKFLAFAIEGNFATNSCVAIYESKDGLLFYQTDRIKSGIENFAHNMGISKSPIGHVSMNDNLVIGYAYSKGSFSTWGRWATKFQKVKLSIIE